jgi:hypothetical protein
MSGFTANRKKLLKAIKPFTSYKYVAFRSICGTLFLNSSEANAFNYGEKVSKTVLEYQTEIPCSLECNIVVDIQKLVRLLGMLKSEEITITEEGKVKADKDEYVFETCYDNNTPLEAYNPFELKEGFIIKTSDLIEAYNSVIVNTTKEKTRYDLDHVLIEQNDAGYPENDNGDYQHLMRFVATDGKTMTKVNKKVTSKKETASYKRVISTDAFNALIKTIDCVRKEDNEKILNAKGRKVNKKEWQKNPQSITIHHTITSIVFTFEGYTFSALLDEDLKFPPYEKVMPRIDDSYINTSVKTADAEESFKKIKMFQKASAIINCSFEKENIAIELQNSGIYACTTSLPCKVHNDIQVDDKPKFNPDFISRTVGVFKKAKIEDITIRCVDAYGAITMNGGDITTVILPIKIDEEEEEQE